MRVSSIRCARQFFVREKCSTNSSGTSPWRDSAQTRGGSASFTSSRIFERTGRDHGRGWVRSSRGDTHTRIGPALRHAQELLVRKSGERKIVFLLTDGRPCDYDRYEGEYGIRDVRKAIETGARHGIMTHAFAIEKRAREQFPRMFKRQHFDVVPSPRAFVESVCGAFARLRLET